jgi:hypothetical protein
MHNHPSGDPTPSKADIAVTRDIVKAAAPLGVTTTTSSSAATATPACAIWGCSSAAQPRPFRASRWMKRS